MQTRTATCRCGQLKAECEGTPIRVSVCHCLDCQKRTGSALAAQARWPEARVKVTGDATTWERIADSGHRATYRFCPHCGSTVAYVIEGWPGVVVGDDVEHSSTPSAVRMPGRQLHDPGREE